MQRQLDAFNLNYQFVDGIDKNELHSKEYRATVAYQIGIDESTLEYFFKNRSGGELACQLSHLKVYNLMKKHKVPRACVLEDDGYLMPVFPEILAASQEVPWDILMLSHYSTRLLYMTMVPGKLRKKHIFLYKLIKSANEASTFLIFNKYVFLYRLMRYKKCYPQLNLYILRLMFLKVVSHSLKKLFSQPVKYDYLSQIGAIPEIEKSSWHKITSKHYIAKPHLSNETIGSGMAYMLTLPMAIKWRERVIQHDDFLDRIPFILYRKGEINLRILVPPCVLIIKNYLDYSVRDNLPPKLVSH